MKKLMFIISLIIFCLNFSFATAKFSGPEIYLTENNHDFGEVRSGATTRWFLEIHNVGDEILILDTFIFDTEHFYLEDTLVFPIEILPSDSISAGIWFRPSGEENYFSFLKIINNDTNHDTAIIELTGKGIEKPWEIGEEFWTFESVSGNDTSILSIISASDISGDGIEDVVIASGNDFITCLNANSSGIADVLWQQQIPDGSVYGQNCLSLLSDINADGYLDIVAGTCAEDRSIVALSGKTGEQLWKLETNEYGGGGCVYQLNVTYDYNGDGVADVLAAAGDDGNGTGPNRVYCLDAFSGNPIWERPLGGQVYSVIGIEDFTGDGQPDVVAGVSNTDETEGSAWAINGANGFNAWNTVMPGKSVRALAQVGDTENNGYKNLVIGDYSGEYRIIDPSTLYFIDVGGIGLFSIEYFVVLEDVNNDGYPDVLVANQGSKAIIMNGAGGNPLLDLDIADKALAVARIADVSGDAKNDILIGTSPENNFIYCINGTHNDILLELDFKTAVTSIQSILDINGDGSMEIIAGGQNGKLVCLSGGTNALVGEKENQDACQVIHGNFPNPFQNETTIYFELHENDLITLNIYDQTGRKTVYLSNQFFTKGSHTLTLKAEDNINLRNGLYFYNISSPNFVVTGKMILIK